MRRASTVARVVKGGGAGPALGSPGPSPREEHDGQHPAHGPAACRAAAQGAGRGRPLARSGGVWSRPISLCRSVMSACARRHAPRRSRTTCLRFSLRPLVDRLQLAQHARLTACARVGRLQPLFPELSSGSAAGVPRPACRRCRRRPLALGHLGPGRRRERAGADVTARVSTSRRAPGHACRAPSGEQAAPSRPAWCRPR